MIGPKPLKGRTAIVVGSRQNIGASIVKLFSIAGASVVVDGRSAAEKIERMVDGIKRVGGTAIGIMAGVGDADAVEAMVHEASRSFRTIEFSMSNDSIREKQPVKEISIKDWQIS